jgi:tetratricopeptide (TPR) repeat protein
VDAAGQPSGQVTADIAAHVEAMIEEGTEAPPSEHSFDQGMMYKELGRLDDAIREFRAAARSERRAIDSLEMIGHCLVDKDEPKAAIECFKLALKKGARGPAATNLKYEIGAAYERLNDLPRAKDWYQACHRDDPEHRDVEVRLESVQARGAGPPGGPRSSNKNKISYL